MAEPHKEREASDISACEQRPEGHSDNERAPAQCDNLEGEGDGIVAGQEFDNGVHFLFLWVIVSVLP